MVNLINFASHKKSIYKMKKLILICGTVLLASSAAHAQNWSLDKAHAKLGFAITHMKISEVEGSFKNFDVNVISSKADFTDAVITLSADINSINTDNDMRDGHIKGADYFDAAKYPSMTFKSTSIQKTSGNNYKVSGILTLHGISKPVILNAKLNGVGENPMSKKTMAGFKITGNIKRSAFGVGEESAMLSDDVALNANIELMKN
jgi:polyisoprenoid-binding protein YceI